VKIMPVMFVAMVMVFNVMTRESSNTKTAGLGLKFYDHPKIIHARSLEVKEEKLYTMS
jgi:hypothetical protein